MERKEILSKLNELKKERNDIDDEITSLAGQLRDAGYPELVGKYFRYTTTSPEHSWKNGAVFYVFSMYNKCHYTECTAVHCAVAYPSKGVLCSSDAFSFEDSYEDDASAFTLEEITKDEFTRTFLSVADNIIEKIEEKM